RALFLDIETTGLAGGAGTKAFLVGLGRFTGDGFELWQGFLRGPEDEAALLDECARRVASAGALVSFFGKSFDRHRLEDKMRLHGIDAPFERCLHLDLYHPCRRLYGAGLANGRLATMEREIAGVERPHDLPGAFAPAAWYDYLAGRAHRLEEVFEHNRDDILSLVAIASALARLASNDAPSALPSTRALALARCAERVGRWRECRRWCQLAMLDAEQAVEAVALAARACEELAEEEAFDGLLARARQLGASELEARVERRRSRVLRRSRARAAEHGP
ncbi:MAG: ribonuclease H-like domain-containing protein, partial [Planctomycetota bacterium]